MCFDCGDQQEHENREERGRLVGRRRPPCCTDLGVLALFLMTQCAIIIVSALSYGEGNVWRVTKPVDCANAFTCGSSSLLGSIRDSAVSMDVVAKSPYLFFYEPKNPSSLKTTCVPSCTSEELISFYNLTSGKEYYCGYNGASQLTSITEVINSGREAYGSGSGTGSQWNAQSSSSNSSAWRNQQRYSRLWGLNPLSELYNDPKDPLCAMLPIPRTVPLMSRCVIPDVQIWLRFDALKGNNITAQLASQQSAIINTVNYFNDLRIRTGFHQVVHDLYEYWTDVLWSFFAALFLGSMFLALIHFRPRSLTVVVTSLLIASSALLTAILWRIYVYYFKVFSQKRSEQALWLTDPAQKKNTTGLVLLRSQLVNEPVYLTLAIISSVGFIVLLPTTLSMLRRMRITEQLYRELSKLIASRMMLLAAPFVTCGFIVIVSTHFYVTLAFITTSDRPVHANSNSTDPLVKNCLTPQVSPLQYCWIILFAGVFWSAEMLITMQRVVVARSVCDYYFTRSKRVVPYHTGDALALVFKHHFGSLALAAVLIPACRVPRMLFGYIRKRFYEAAIVSGSGGRHQRVATVGGGLSVDEGDQSSAGISCGEVICSPCLGCQHGFFRFIDTSLLVYVAMRGYDVLKAARDSYFLLERNSLRVAALSSASRFILLIGKLSVAFTVTSLVVVFHQLSRDISTSFYLPNIVFVWCLSYYVADCFFSFYEAAVDSLLCCICEDLEVNDGSLAREFLMSVSLMDTIRTTSSALNKLSRHARTEYAASIIIDHNLRRSQKYKKDKQLLSTTRM